MHTTRAQEESHQYIDVGHFVHGHLHVDRRLEVQRRWEVEVGQTKLRHPSGFCLTYMCSMSIV